MNTINKDGFLLIAHDREDYHEMPLAKLRDLLDRNKAWIDGLAAQGKLLGGHPLEQAGVILSKKNGKLISDGPFAEAKEAIGGFLHLNVATLAEAVAIAEAAPALDYGLRMEVRPVAAECAKTTALREREQQEKLAAVAA